MPKAAKFFGLILGTIAVGLLEKRGHGTISFGYTAKLDLSLVLGELVWQSGSVQESYGGFRIKVLHSQAFPWASVFKELLYRGFRVDVTRHKADLFIDARP